MKYELDQRLCLDPAAVSELYVYGNDLSEETSYFTIHVEKCINTTTAKTCKPQTYIDQFFKDVKLNLIFVNQLMDFKEFNTPIRQYIDDPIIVQLSPDYESETTIEISPGKTELIDDFFKYWEKISYKFAHVHNVIEKRLQHYPSNDNIVASVKIALDRKMFVYGRVADTVF